MGALLGHASLDEHGFAIGGAAGDQTGKEVCARQWYDKGWHLLLRPKTAALAENSARACEKACENPCIGYDQGGRNTLYAAAQAVSFDLAAISTPCECDCSSLMHVCALAGGADIPYVGNGCTTRTMASAFVASGDYEKLTDSRFLNSDEALRRGDILVREGSHTAMVLRRGEKACSVSLPQLDLAMESDAVKSIQILLLGRGYPLGERGADAYFGPETAAALRQFQLDMNLAPDGICGEKTWRALLGQGGVG